MQLKSTCGPKSCNNYSKNMLSRVLDVRRKAKTFISASNLNELKGKGKTRYT